MAVTAVGLGKQYEAGWTPAGLWRRLRAAGGGAGRIQALSDLNLEVPDGCIAGILGPNGAGKTTLLRCLLGILRPSRGQVTLLGEDPLSTPSVRARVGALIGHPAFVNYLSGRRNLELRARFYPGGSERVPGLLERLGLKDAANKEVRAYSTGMRQRLGIAASLLPDPELWILDEPTSGLDPRGRSEVRELIQEIGGQPHRTVLVSSHDLHEIQQVCDHVLVLAQGRLLVSGPVATLLSQENEVIDLEVDDSERAREILQVLPECQNLENSGSPGGLTLSGPSGLSSKVARSLVEGGVQLRVLTPRRRSLEDFFLETVEETPCS